MKDVEGRVLASYPTPPPFWKRYVDDTCTANSIEPNIQVTVKPEENGELPFLDTLITHHPDGSLSTRVYRKKINTDNYLHFQSHHPLVQKTAMTRTLLVIGSNLH